MRLRSILLAAAALLLAAGADAQQARTAPDLLNDVSIRAAADALDGMDHLGGPLRRLHVAYERDRAERARGRVLAPFSERVALSAVRGERVVIDAIAASEGEAATLAADLAAVGFEETGRFRHVVSGYLPLDAIEAAAAVPTLRAAHAALARSGRLSSRQLAEIAALRARVGSEEGESSVSLRADNARSLFGVDGTGFTIGVLSDSYDNLGGAATGVGSGDLPSGVTVVDELAPATGSDEGRAMMELAFDIAPGVDFAFHTAFEGVASFAAGIGDLIAAGADIVVDDVGYSVQPAFQDDIIAQAADDAFAGGTPYFSAAGNTADAAYQGDWADSGLDAAFDGGTITGDLHNFDPGGGVDAFQEIVIGSSETVSLTFHFDEPSSLAGPGQAPTSNYDIYFLDSPSVAATVLAGGIDDNPSTTIPFEFISLTTGSTFYVAIIKVSGDDRTLAYTDFLSDDLSTISGAEYNGAATVVGHPNAAGAFSTGASAWYAAPTMANGLTEAVVNSFSSYGGRDIHLEDDGTRLVTPEARSKPDAVGSDGDNNTFFGFDAGDGNPAPNFFGTSAAAPNAAAVAALMFEAAGGPLPPAAVYGTLEATAEDLVDSDGSNPDTAPGFDDRSGNGYIRADRAVAAVALPTLAVRINEADINQAGADTEEFIELIGPAGLPLDGLVLVGLDGATDTDYFAIDLDGETIPGDGFHVTCGGTIADCDLDTSLDIDMLGNFSEGLVLALGEGFDYTSARIEAPDPDDIVDVLLHTSGGDAPDPGLETLTGATITFDEAIGGDEFTQSLGRLNGGAHTDGTSTWFYPMAPSAGAANPEDFEITQDDIFDGAGFRLLASPFAETWTADGTDVTDVVGGTAVGQLAAANMVQGLPAGSTFPAEYDGFDDNVLSSYTGSAYGSPADTDHTFAPGAGFFWYWFDNALGPLAGGTSVSRELSTYELSIGGIPNELGFISAPVSETSDGFYMLGNPFPYDFNLVGIVSPTGGTLSTSFYTYDPDGASFTVLTTADNVAPLQGFFPEVLSGAGSGATGTDPTFAFDETLVEADLAAPTGAFAGLETAEARVAFAVEGATPDGRRIADRAAMVRLLPDATEGPDRHDLSKLEPPGDRVMLAPVGTADGAPRRQGVVSLPDVFEGALPLAFAATVPGPFTLSWSVEGIAEGTDLALTDLATGTVLDLRATPRYTFDATPTDWDDRFVLRVGADLGTSAGDDAPASVIGQVAPNPTAEAATLLVSLAEGGPVRVAVVDVLGREVAVPFEGTLAAGAARRIALDTSRLAVGPYFVRVVGAGVSETRRLSVVR